MAEQAGGTIFAYVGTYSPATEEGILLYRFSPSTGALTLEGGASGVASPSFLAIAPNRRSLFAVSEVGEFEGRPTGGVCSFSLDPKTGKLSRLNDQSSMGSGPCHLSVDRTGSQLVVANYGSGSVALLPIHNDGMLGQATDTDQHHGSSVNPGRQEGPHAHSIGPDPTNRYVLSCDLGLDKVFVYKLDLAEGKLRPNDEPWGRVKPGAGPRHFDFHPNGRFVYVIAELDNTITAFRFDSSRGTLHEIQAVSTLPNGFTGTSHCAEVQVAPSGKFVYGSNRGHDSIAIFAVDPETGRLTEAGHEPTQGKNPRHFSLDPTGSFLLVANQDTDNIVSFAVDGKSGGLHATGHVTKAPKPVCIEMIRADPSA